MNAFAYISYYVIYSNTYNESIDQLRLDGLPATWLEQIGEPGIVGISHDQTTSTINQRRPVSNHFQPQ